MKIPAAGLGALRADGRGPGVGWLAGALATGVWLCRCFPWPSVPGWRGAELLGADVVVAVPTRFLMELGRTPR